MLSNIEQMINLIRYIPFISFLDLTYFTIFIVIMREVSILLNKPFKIIHNIRPRRIDTHLNVLCFFVLSGKSS